jgi:hypothetical protein
MGVEQIMKSRFLAAGSGGAIRMAAPVGTGNRRIHPVGRRP